MKILVIATDGPELKRLCQILEENLYEVTIQTLASDSDLPAHSGEEEYDVVLKPMTGEASESGAQPHSNRIEISPGSVDSQEGQTWEEGMEELKQRAREMDHFREMFNMLQVCTDTNEAYGVIATFVRQLFSGLAGALMVLDQEKNRYIVQHQWQHPNIAYSSIDLDACWALRLGRPFFKENTSSGPLCGHINTPMPSSYLCIPILAQDKMVGLLHLQTTSSGQSISPAQQHLASAVAEQVSLGISNLRLRENLRQRAIHDELTGLYNYLFMEETLEVELHRSKRSGRPFGIMMFDLDHFKELNTTFGHPRVNQFLREFGKMLKSSVRAGDIACRYGGDEFLIILPETSQEITCQRAEELRQQIRKLCIRNESSSRGITVSIGVASYPDNGASVEELIQAVDNAAYQAKI